MHLDSIFSVIECKEWLLTPELPGDVQVSEEISCVILKLCINKSLSSFASRLEQPRSQPSMN